MIYTILIICVKIFICYDDQKPKDQNKRFPKTKDL